MLLKIAGNLSVATLLYSLCHIFKTLTQVCTSTCNTVIVLRLFEACPPVGCQLSEDIRRAVDCLVEQIQHGHVVGQVRQNTQLDLLEICATNVSTLYLQTVNTTVGYTPTSSSSYAAPSRSTLEHIGSHKNARSKQRTIIMIIMSM